MAKRQEFYIPDGVIASCILDASSVSFLGHIAMYILLKQVGGQNTVHKVLPYIRVIEVVLK
jgi:hypothetical protein